MIGELAKTHEGAILAWQSRRRAQGKPAIAEPQAPKPPHDTAARREAALKNLKPQTRTKELIAHESEQRVAAALGGEGTTDAAPLDIWWPSAQNPQIGVEVKTLIDAHPTNVRVNMRRDSRTEKEKALEGGKRGFVVLVDQRGRKGLRDANFKERIFFREGMGAWRLNTMTEVKSLGELRHALGVSA